MHYVETNAESIFLGERAVGLTSSTLVHVVKKLSV